jgi:AGCS family alanine or glycine:cation symporter
VVCCIVIIVGSSASMANATDFSDAALFAMSIPNLIGVYFLLPVVRQEFASFLAFTKRLDAGELIDEADKLERKDWEI